MTSFFRISAICLAILAALFGEGGLPSFVFGELPEEIAIRDGAAGSDIASGPKNVPATRALEGDSRVPSRKSVRPAWVAAQPQRVNGEYRIPVEIGPYHSLAECRQHLRDTVAQAIDDYVELLVGPAARGKVKLPWSYVEQRIIRERFEESRVFQLTSTQQATMHSLHVLLGFDQAANQYIRQLWRTAEGLLHLARVGLLFAIIVWTIAVVWGYLRLDLASHGRYRWSLRSAMLILMALPWVLIGFFTLR